MRLLTLPDVHLIKHQIPVAYDAVDDIVPKLWDQHQPEVRLAQNLPDPDYCMNGLSPGRYSLRCQLLC